MKHRYAVLSEELQTQRSKDLFAQIVAENQYLRKKIWDDQQHEISAVMLALRLFMDRQRILDGEKPNLGALPIWFTDTISSIYGVSPDSKPS